MSGGVTMGVLVLCCCKRRSANERDGGELHCEEANSEYEYAQRLSEDSQRLLGGSTMVNRVVTVEELSEGMLAVRSVRRYETKRMRFDN